jgi:uncharacterized membrane protein
LAETATIATRSTAQRTSRWWWPAALLAVGVAGYSLRYIIVGEAAFVPELADSFRARIVPLLIHTTFGPIALVLGIVNLLPAMRRRRWALHRLLGRIYMISGLTLGLAGGYLAFFAVGGTFARLGFLFLAVGTVLTIVFGYRSIRRRNIIEHREWMLRSYSLIFGAVMLRIWLPLLIIAHAGEFIPAYRIVAWLAWVPNILLVEWLIRRGWRPAYEHVTL